MSLSIHYYTQISIAWLNQLDIYLSSIHVPALSCRWRLLERRCFLLWRCSVLRRCMFLGCSCTANPRSVLVSHSVFLFKLKAINIELCHLIPSAFQACPLRWLLEFLAHAVVGIREVFTVPPIFHMDSTGLQSTFFTANLYLDCLWLKWTGVHWSPLDWTVQLESIWTLTTGKSYQSGLQRYGANWWIILHCLTNK